MPARILIIGPDARPSRVESRLAAAGYVLVLADDAATGFAMHEADPFDLVIHDLGRPSLDGLEFLARLRAQPERNRPAILVLADVPVAEASELASGLGVDSCLPKPVDVRMLLDLVDHMLKPERRASASTWYVEDDPVDPLGFVPDVGHVSAPEDPDSVTFH